MVHLRDKVSAVDSSNNNNNNNETKIKITVCYNMKLCNMADKLISTRLHSVTSKKIITSVLTVVRTSNLTNNKPEHELVP